MSVKYQLVGLFKRTFTAMSVQPLIYSHIRITSAADFLCRKYRQRCRAVASIEGVCMGGRPAKKVKKDFRHSGESFFRLYLH